MHGITSIDSVHSLASTWHHLETIENNILYDNSGWNFEIEKVALRDNGLKPVKEIVLDKAGNPIERKVFGHFSGGYLLTTTTGESYPLIQPREIYDSIQILLDEFGFKIACSGTVYGRKRMFLNLENDSSNFEVLAGDAIRPNLRVVAGNDKAVSPSWFTGTTRIVCANTFNASLKELRKILKKESSNNDFAEKIRHSKNFSAKMENVKSALVEFYANLELVRDAMKGLTERPIDAETANLVTLGFLSGNKPLSTRSENVSEEINSLFLSGKGNKGETVYDLLNGFTEFFTSKNSDNPAKAFLSSEFGSAAIKKEEFFLSLLTDESLDALAKKGAKLLKEKDDAPQTVEMETV